MDDGGFFRRETAHRAPCQHQWEPAVDDDGKLLEPPYDVCIHCGEVRE